MEETKRPGGARTGVIPAPAFPAGSIPGRQQSLYGIRFMIYVTGDWHLGHKKIIELAHRPEDFGSEITNNHGVGIERNDVLIHLGDVALGRAGIDLAAYYLARMAGFGVRLIACRGNHDAGLPQLMAMGFHFACDSFKMRYMGHDLIFSHEPIHNDLFTGDLNIHGHLHHIEGHLITVHRIGIKRAKAKSKRG